MTMNNWDNDLQIAVDDASRHEDQNSVRGMLSNIESAESVVRSVLNKTENITEPLVKIWDPWHPPFAMRMPRYVYSIVGIYMSFVLFFAIVLNTIVLYTAYKNRVVRTPLNYIVINLTAADLIGALCGNTLSVMANVAGCFFLGKAMCVIEGYTASISGVAFTWMWSFFWHFPMLTMYNGFEAEGFGTNCAPNYWMNDKGPRAFLIVYFVFCFVLPYLAIGFSYGKLILSLREMKKQSMVQSSSGVSADQEVTKMVVVLVFAFLFCWCPYAVVAMTNVFLKNKIYVLGAIPAFFAKSAAVYNPLVYIGLNKQFRECVVKTLFKGLIPRDEGGASMMSSAVSTNKTAPA